MTEFKCEMGEEEEEEEETEVKGKRYNDGVALVHNLT
jgi:hypothetical protein